mgnify:CR=1 FL=1|jgi:hypothetical protein
MLCSASAECDRWTGKYCYGPASVLPINSAQLNGPQGPTAHYEISCEE